MVDNLEDDKSTPPERAASAEELALLADNMPVCCWVADADGSIYWYNRRWYQYSGTTPEQMLGWGWQSIHDPEMLPDIMARWTGSIATGEPFDMVFQLRSASGEYRPFLTRIRPYRDLSGRITHWFGNNVEITEQRAVEDALARSEALFRSLAATVPAFIWVSDPDGKYTFTNIVFQQFTGRSAEELVGSGWVDTVHPDDRDRVTKAWNESWQTGSTFDVECRIRHHADGYRWFVARGSPVRDESGATTQWAGTCLDIDELITTRRALADVNADLETKVQERTADLNAAMQTLQRENDERQAAEEQVRQLQKMEAVGQLTGGIAHDFNNMLAIVIGSLGMATKRLTSDPDRARELLGHAEEGANRAAQLTSRLLAFSRQQPLAPQVLDANKLVASMAELLRRTLGEQVHVETVLGAGAWRVSADPAALENALANICINARDAMPGGGKLTIETANSHIEEPYATVHDVSPGQYLLVSVTDTGTGMPAEIIGKVFEPFYTTKGVGHGTGLGLSQVYGFVRQSDGHVKIYSEPGHGTTVKIYLPRHLGKEDGISGGQTALQGPSPRGRAGEVILVVEDDPQVRHTTVDMLRDLGYTVIQAANGEEAVEQITLQPLISLLLTDVVMPGMNGRKLADAALGRYPNLPVLFMTGYTRNAIVHNGTLDPGVALLSKPFTQDSLARKVRSLIDDRSPP